MRPIIIGLAIALIAPAAFAQTASSQNSPSTRAENSVPDDLRQMYRDYSAALLSHDIERAMSFFSERYLHEGRDKAQRRAFTLEWINDLTRHEIQLTRFTPIDGHRAFIEGRGDDNFVGFVIGPEMQVIKENGRWKLYGNQKRYDR